MHPHITACVPGAILLAGLACVSCSDVAPADATAPSSIRAIALSVQPEKVEPEFLPPIGRCTGHARFGRASSSSPEAWRRSSCRSFT